MPARKLAHLHVSIRIDGERSLSRPAGVDELCDRALLRLTGAFAELPEVLHAVRVLQVEGHHLLRRELELPVSIGSAIDAGIQEAVEPKSDSDFLREAFHVRDFMLIHGEGHGLELHRHAALHELRDSAAALLERAGNLCDRLVRLLGVTVDADFDEQGRMLGEEVRDTVGHQCAVREDGDEQAALHRVKVDLGEIGANQHLAAGHEQEEAALLRHLVHQFQESGRVEFARDFRGISGGFVHIAVNTAQIAAEGGLEDPIDRGTGARRAERQGGEALLGNPRGGQRSGHDGSPVRPGSESD